MVNSVKGVKGVKGCIEVSIKYVFFEYAIFCEISSR